MNEAGRIGPRRDRVAVRGRNRSIVVIRWKDLFERLEDVIDSCEQAAHILEGLPSEARERVVCAVRPRDMIAMFTTR